jgi:predicted nucleic acid-binding protein
MRQQDDCVLATCVVGDASRLVTGDKRLLELGSHRGTAIVTPRAFLALLEDSTFP